MSGLPLNWAVVPLSEIALWSSGGTPSRSNPSYYGGTIPWIKTGDLGERYLKKVEEYITEDALKNSSAKLFPANAVAMAMYGATIGKTSILTFEAATNQACAVAVPNGATTAEFLYYLLLNEKEKFISKGKGGAQPNISQSIIKEHLVVLPPLNEQKRIADKLDSILAKVDRAQTRLDKIPAILKRFRQSVLSAATSGELTKDWFGDSEHYYSQLDNEISKQKKLSLIKKTNDEELNLAKKLFGDANWSRWKAYPLEALVYPERGIPYGIVQTGDAQEVGIPTIRCGDVKPLRILVDNLKKVSPEIEVKYIRTRLKGGEVLLAIRGTVGHAAVVSDDLVALKANISREVAMIPVRELINPNYIALLLQSPGGYSALTEKVRGVAQKGINLADVKRFVTPLPCFDEQSEIVNRVQALFAKADKVEKQYLESKARMDRLTQSIIAKAFRGELVPQDPNDESADKLLKKIKADNLKNKGKKK